MMMVLTNILPIGWKSTIRSFSRKLMMTDSGNKPNQIHRDAFNLGANFIDVFFAKIEEFRRYLVCPCIQTASAEAIKSGSGSTNALKKIPYR